MIDTARNLIGDIVSGKIKDQRLSLLADELVASERKLSEATIKIGDLETRLQKAEARLSQFDRQKPKDICPSCGRAAGQLIETKGNPNPHFASMGFKQAYYKCDSCGHDYDKEVE